MKVFGIWRTSLGTVGSAWRVRRISDEYRKDGVLPVYTASRFGNSARSRLYKPSIKASCDAKSSPLRLTTTMEPAFGTIRSLSEPSPASWTLWMSSKSPPNVAIGSCTLGRYDLRSTLARFRKHVCVFSLHWAKSSVERRSSANTTVNVPASVCDSSRAANSAVVYCDSAGT
uniref:(northern house mosquito) hypothetical protein n=1 Tax=Culex pipiens TaxID=7175 RepID=A0A8D8GKK9_CULPI